MFHVQYGKEKRVVKSDGNISNLKRNIESKFNISMKNKKLLLYYKEFEDWADLDDELPNGGKLLVEDKEPYAADTIPTRKHIDQEEHENEEARNASADTIQNYSDVDKVVNTKGEYVGKDFNQANVMHNIKDHQGNIQTGGTKNSSTIKISNSNINAKNQSVIGSGNNIIGNYSTDNYLKTSLENPPPSMPNTAKNLKRNSTSKTIQNVKRAKTVINTEGTHIEGNKNVCGTMLNIDKQVGDIQSGGVQNISNVEMDNTTVNADQSIIGSGTNFRQNSPVQVNTGLRFRDNQEFDVENLKVAKTSLQIFKDHVYDSDNVYPVANWGNFQALLINNFDFKDKDHNRIGAKVDGTNLTTLLRQLGFKVTLKENITKEEINEIVEDFLAPSNIAASPLTLLYIGSHGLQKKNADHFMDANNEWIKASDIIEKFDATNCPLLAQKPKLFWFQICRVKYNEQGEKIDSDDASFTLNDWFRQETPIPDDTGVKKPQKLADMHLAYATAPGEKAYRYGKSGSWFVISICKVFCEYACKEDLASMFTMVNAAVMKEGRNEEVEMCFCSTTLRRKVYFYPHEKN